MVLCPLRLRVRNRISNLLIQSALCPCLSTISDSSLEPRLQSKVEMGCSLRSSAPKLDGFTMEEKRRPQIIVSVLALGPRDPLYGE